MVSLANDKVTTLVDDARFGGDVVTALLPDSHDNLWIGGNWG